MWDHTRIFGQSPGLNMCSVSDRLTSELISTFLRCMGSMAGGFVIWGGQDCAVQDERRQLSHVTQYSQVTLWRLFPFGMKMTLEPL